MKSIQRKPSFEYANAAKLQGKKPWRGKYKPLECKNTKGQRRSVSGFEKPAPDLFFIPFFKKRPDLLDFKRGYRRCKT